MQYPDRQAEVATNANRAPTDVAVGRVGGARRVDARVTGVCTPVQKPRWPTDECAARTGVDPDAALGDMLALALGHLGADQISSRICIERAVAMLDAQAGQKCSHSSPTLAQPHADAIVHKVQLRLSDRGEETLSVAAMAEYAGLEERTFSRRFRKATGLRPKEYQQNLRIAQARELLEVTAEKIESIAWSVGYQDPCSFRRIFLKITGFLPSDYRLAFRRKERLNA